MFSRLKDARKQAAIGPNHSAPANEHGDIQSSTPTLLEVPVSDLSHGAHSSTREKAADEQSFHSLDATKSNDAAKYPTSPESDLKTLPSATDPVLAHLQADSNEKQDARVADGATDREDEEGYLKGLPLWMAYLSMLLSIFLVSLDFTIM